MATAAAFAAEGIVAAERDIFYDPYFGNDDELITFGPDGRSYVPNPPATAAIRQNQRATPPTSNCAYTVDCGPQITANMKVSATYFIGGTISTAIDIRVYGRLTSFTACYYAEWNLGNGLIAVGYRDGTGPHSLATNFFAATPNTIHTITLICSGTTISAQLDGGFTTTATDTRNSQGKIGYQFFAADQYIDTFSCVRA